MTERGRREYAAVMRARYPRAAERREGGCSTSTAARPAASQGGHPALRRPTPPGARRPPPAVRAGAGPEPERVWLPVISSPGSCSSPPAGLAHGVGEASGPAGRPRRAPRFSAEPGHPTGSCAPRGRRPRQPRRGGRGPPPSPRACRFARGGTGATPPRARCKPTSSCIAASPPPGSIAHPRRRRRGHRLDRPRARLGPLQRRVRGAIPHLPRRLPFPLRQWHTDNGGEFLNAAVLDCRQHQVRVTRGRAYRKNDQAWVEQRNGLPVRRVVG